MQHNSRAKARKVIEPVLNVAIIISALVLVGILAKRYVFITNSPKRVAIGDKMSLPDVN